MPDAIDDPELLWRQVLELVDDHRFEVVAVQTGDTLVGEDELGEARQVVVRQAALSNALALDIEGVWHTSSDQPLLDGSVVDGLLLRLAEQLLHGA
jgi:hypothetical protein